MHPQWLVTSSRFGRRDLEFELDSFLELEGRPELVIVGGDASDSGGDGQTARWCIARGIPLRTAVVVDDDWEVIGPGAGPLRNSVMVSWLTPADVCLAFPARGYSPGTLGCARMAHRAGVLTYVVDLDDPYVLRPGEPDQPLQRHLQARSRVAGCSRRSPKLPSLLAAP